MHEAATIAEVVYEVKDETPDDNPHARRVRIIEFLLNQIRNQNALLGDYVSDTSVVDIIEKQSLFFTQTLLRFEEMVAQVRQETDGSTSSQTFLTINPIRRIIRTLIRNRLSFSQRSALHMIRFVVLLDDLLFDPRQRRRLAKAKKRLMRDHLDKNHYFLYGLDDGQVHQLAEKIAVHFSDMLDAVDRSVEDWHRSTQGSDKNVAFISHLFPTTWSSFCRSLKKQTVKSIWLGTENVDHFSGYGVVENTLIPVDAQIVCPFWGVVYAMCQLEDTELLLSGECFYGPNWIFENTSFMYMLLICVSRTVNAFKHQDSSLNCIMYDGIKPVASRATHSVDLRPDSLITVLYKQFIKEMARIVYNSNGPIFTDFIKATCAPVPPLLNFYRYGEAPARHVERLPFNEQSIHMVCITLALSEFEEPSRDSVDSYVQLIVESGIYFHYYCDLSNPVIPAFRKRLKPEFRKFFIPHAIQKNPAVLIEEISQYHIGFNPSDHYAFARAITTVNCRFYRDAMACFLQSTFGTSFLIYAAAGLPFILPRGCVDAQNLLAPLAIPMTFSEFAHIPAMLRSNYFAALQKEARKHAHLFYCDNHIVDFIDFIWPNTPSN